MSSIQRGLADVVVTETRLSRVDGDAGELVIAGFPVAELAPRATFEETLFLLWNDRLPGAEELAELRARLAARRTLPAATEVLLRSAAAEGASAMDALRMGVSTLGLLDPELHRTELQSEPAEANQLRALRLVAALPTLVATHSRLSEGRPPVAPDPELSHAANYLFMLTGERPDPRAVRALETYLNTTVDHGMNASTFTARVVTSTRSDLGSAIAAAIGALKGPLHGGAPGPALDMVFALQKAAASGGRSLAAVTDAHVRERVACSERIMGFGHRVYRVRDPRADVLGAAVERLYPDPGENALYDDARQVEEVVLRVLAELKPERRLQTNVEFYTALLLHSLGMPTALFTPTFAVARVAGWTAHALEQIAEDRLIRPRVAYEGPCDRRWQPVEERAPAAL